MLNTTFKYKCRCYETTSVICSRIQNWFNRSIEALHFISKYNQVYRIYNRRRDCSQYAATLQIVHSQDMLRTEFDANKLEWNGRIIDSDFKINQSLGQAVLHSLEVNGPRVAQICANTGQTKTFNEIRTMTINATNSLQSLGCGKGDLICFLTTNTADAPPITFAALYLGVQVAVLSEYFSKMELERFLKLLKPKILFCDVDVYPKCLDFLSNDVTIFTFDGTIDGTSSANILFENSATDTRVKPVEINALTQTAIILTTSGTSGRSKCVRLSHASILHMVSSIKCIFGPSEIVQGYTYFHGVSGIRLLFGSTLHGSTRIVNHLPFSPKRYFEIVEKFKVTVSISGSTLRVDLLHHADISSSNLSSLKYFCTASAKVAYSVIQAMSKHMPRGRYCYTYGMTETTSTIAVNLRHMNNDSVGQLISGYKAKIVNEAGERLGVGEIGELCLKLPYPMLGYIKDDHSVDNMTDTEGFFITGDLAKFDGNGDLFIVDRKKEVFKHCGLPVTPSDVEGQLNKIDGVKKSYVVPIPDKHDNCLPASLIVKTPNSKCTEQSIHEWMANNSSFCNQLRGGVYFVDELPINARGKMDRKVAKSMAVELFRKSRNFIH